MYPHPQASDLSAHRLEGSGLLPHISGTLLDQPPSSQPAVTLGSHYFQLKAAFAKLASRATRPTWLQEGDEAFPKVLARMLEAHGVGTHGVGQVLLERC